MCVTAATSQQIFWREPGISSRFRTGVSLHSHTMYSEESLHGALRFMAAIPYLCRAIRQQEAEYERSHGLCLDLRQGFWIPSLTARQAYRLEQKQIERMFGLAALVSLTDHDDIRAGSQLAVLERFADAPVSTEWTVPFGETFFHLGVHNLPHAEAGNWMRDLSEYTARPRPERLADLLELLDANADVLVVVNHPLWDEKGLGRKRHEAALGELLRTQGRFLHALEVNGFRTMAENQRVLRIGEEWSLPVVAGGDRHGLEPNAILNLSCAVDLKGFIYEVRREGRSHVVFMPQYRRLQLARVTDTVMDILRDYPQNFAGRRAWPDRVFYRHPESGAVVPFRAVCNGRGMEVIAGLNNALRVIDRRRPSVILTSA